MRKFGLAAALTAAVALSGLSTTPARADAGATAAIITASAVVVTALLVKCKDAQGNEYACIFPPRVAPVAAVWPWGNIFVATAAPAPAKKAQKKDK